MGIALLPVAAGMSVGELAVFKTNLPEGFFAAARGVNRLLEAVEDGIFSKKSLGGGFGLVSVKNALDYHAHREFSTPLIDIE